MKKINKLYMAFGLLAILTASSCSMEDPFIHSGEGVLKMETAYRSDIKVSTRASIEGYEESALNDKLVVYIENNKGVIRKFIKKSSLPESISLPV